MVNPYYCRYLIFYAFCLWEKQYPYVACTVTEYQGTVKVIANFWYDRKFRISLSPLFSAVELWTIRVLLNYVMAVFGSRCMFY